MKIRKGDTVLVIRGKDRGKRGKVHRTMPQDEKVLVEGVNLVKRHVKPRPNLKQAGIVEKEAPLHVAKVMLLCSKCNHPTRIGHQFLETGAKVRVCRACGEVID